MNVLSCIVETMKIRTQVKDTLTDVSDASRKVVASTEWATVALIAVAVVSILALTLSVVALTEES